jgi:hypothetical protein
VEGVTAMMIKRNAFTSWKSHTPGMLDFYASQLRTRAQDLSEL